MLVLMQRGLQDTQKIHFNLKYVESVRVLTSGESREHVVYQDLNGRPSSGVFHNP
jgi:hypothetical protein